jgi:hypothetical protein
MRAKKLLLTALPVPVCPVAVSAGQGELPGSSPEKPAGSSVKSMTLVWTV